MDIKLDEDSGDIALVNGDFTVTDIGVDDLAQRLQIRLNTFQGEWFMDSTLGIDYFNRVFGKNRSKTAIDAIMQAEILKEPDALQIVSYESSLGSNRTFTCIFRVRTEAGAITSPISFNLSSPT